MIRKEEGCLTTVGHDGFGVFFEVKVGSQRRGEETEEESIG